MARAPPPADGSVAYITSKAAVSALCARREQLRPSDLITASCRDLDTLANRAACRHRSGR
jgi:hypothetical protein